MPISTNCMSCRTAFTCLKTIVMPATKNETPMTPRSVGGRIVASAPTSTVSQVRAVSMLSAIRTARITRWTRSVATMRKRRISHAGTVLM